MKKNWKVLVATAAIVVIVAVAVVLINFRPNEQTAPPQREPDNGMVAGKLGFPVSKLNIGEGGTKTAADGKTPIGYNGTCDSAAQAAANYTPALFDVNTKTWDTQKATLKALASPESWVKDATVLGDTLTDTAAKGNLSSFESGWLDQTDVKAGGLYRVVSCEPKKIALVQVAYAGLSVSNTLPSGYFGTSSMELTWKDDWKISNVLVRIDDTEFKQKFQDEGPAGGLVGTPTGMMPALDNALVSRYFENLSKEGWVEYANAKR